MRRIRKILVWFGGTLLGLILLLVILGYIFEDKIHLMAIKELSKALNAKIEVRETQVSFLRSWPDVQIELEDLKINPFESQNPQDVISLKSAELQINLWSFFSDRLEIHTVELNHPVVHYQIGPKGKSNFADMFMVAKDSNQTEKAQMVFDLTGIHIEDGQFLYQDLPRKTEIQLDSIFLGLSGDFSAEQTDFDTELALHIQHWENQKVNWVTDRHLSADLLVDAQLGETENYKLKKAELVVSAVHLNLTGEINRAQEGYQLDLAYFSSRNDFDAFMSLLPGGLLDLGREYEYEGDFKTEGWVRGLAGKGKVPSVYNKFSVQNGEFQYVDYDSRLSQVNIQGECLYNQQEKASSYFECKEVKAKLNEKTFAGKFSYRNFLDPHLAFQLQGDLNLTDIKEFYPPFADNSQLRGEIGVDLAVDGKINDFKNRHYQSIKARGDLALKQVEIADPRIQHAIKKLNGKVKVDNDHIQVNQLKGIIGHSDFDVSGLVTEYLPWFFEKRGQVKGIIELTSDKLDLNDWLVAENGTEQDGEDKAERFVFNFPENVDFSVKTHINNFHLAKLNARQVDGECRLHNKHIKLHHLAMQTMQGTVILTGSVHAPSENICEIVMDAEIKTININQTFRTFDQLSAFSLVEENLFGSFSGNISVNGTMDEYLELDPNSLVSHGNVELKHGQLIDFEPLEGLAVFIKLEELKDIKFSDVKTNFQIENGYFFIPRMSVTANRYQLEVRGKHGFDNSLDYRVAVGMPRKEAERSTNSEVAALVEIEAPEKNRILIPVKITGTVDHPKYALDGNFVKESIAEKLHEEGEEMKAGFQEEMEEEFGGVDSLSVEDLIEIEEDPADTSKKAVTIFDKIKNPFKKLKKPRKGSRSN